MDIFYDWEFLEDGRTIEPISIGMVREDGRELYLVNEEVLDLPRYTRTDLHKRICEHKWLMENVVPGLPLDPDAPEPVPPGRGQKPYFWVDPNAANVMPLRLIRRLVQDFVVEVADPELWAWFAAYDHVALGQLFGKMIDMPHGFPWYTNDIRTLKTLAGPTARASEPEQTEGVHNALEDARHNRKLHHHYMAHLDIRRRRDTISKERLPPLGPPRVAGVQLGDGNNQVNTFG